MRPKELVVYGAIDGVAFASAVLMGMGLHFLSYKMATNWPQNGYKMENAVNHNR